MSRSPSRPPPKTDGLEGWEHCDQGRPGGDCLCLLYAQSKVLFGLLNLVFESLVLSTYFFPNLFLENFSFSSDNFAMF